MTAGKVSLDRALISGLGWNATGRWLGQIISWSSTLIVVRFLTPADYGIVAMGGVLFSLIAMLSEAGIHSAIVHRQERSTPVLHQLTTIAVLLGLTGMLISFLLANPLARFFDEPRLTSVIMVVGASYAVMGLRVVPIAVLKRDMAFRFIAMNDFLVVVVTALTSVIIAWRGGGYWALIISSVAGTLVATATAWRAAPQALRMPVWADISEAVVFGTHRLTSTLANWFRGSADSVVIGRWLGQGPLGAYRVAMDFASLPLEKVGGIILQVVYPVVAAVKDDRNALARYLLLLTEGLAMVTWPLAIGLILVADLALPVVLGDQWMAAVVPLMIFSGAAMVRTIAPLVDTIAVVRGEARLISRVAIAGSLLTVGAMIPASHWGVTGVAGVWALAFPVVMIPALRVAMRETGVSLVRYLGALIPTALACMAEIAAVVGIRSAGAVSDLSEPLQLAACIAVGGVTFVVAIAILAWNRVKTVHAILVTRGDRAGA